MILSTAELYRSDATPTGYTQERVNAVHRPCLEQMFSAWPNRDAVVSYLLNGDAWTIAQQNASPFLLCISGGQAAGKTRLMELLLDSRSLGGLGWDDLLIVTNDLYKSIIPEFNQYKQDADPNISASAFPLIREETLHLTRLALRGAMAVGRSVIINTSTPEVPLYREWTELAKEHGYATGLYGVRIYPETYWQRVTRRAEETGRRVLPEEQLANHQAFQRNWARLTPLFDDFILFDNDRECSPPQLENYRLSTWLQQRDELDPGRFIAGYRKPGILTDWLALTRSRTERS